MSFADAVKTCLRKYFAFSGRASRPEYWWFFLFVTLVGAVAAFLDSILFGTVTTSVETTDTSVDARATADSGPIYAVASLGLFFPHLAAAWRRMQDSGRRGFLVLLPIILSITAGLVLVFGIGVADAFASGGSMDVLFTRATILILIPTLIVLFVSPLLVLWWLTRPSQEGANAYGPNPYEVSP